MSDSKTESKDSDSSRLERATGKLKEMVSDYAYLQLAGFRLTMLIIASLVSNRERSSLEQGNLLNWSRVGFVFIAVVIIILTYKIQHWDSNKKEIQVERWNRETLKRRFQAEGFTLLVDLLDEASSLDEKRKIIRDVPRLLSLIPADAINETMATGFQGLMEAIAMQINQLERLGEKVEANVQAKINHAFDKLTSKIPGLKDTMPRPEPAEDSLVPKDPSFPKSEAETSESMTEDNPADELDDYLTQLKKEQDKE